MVAISGHQRQLLFVVLLCGALLVMYGLYIKRRTSNVFQNTLIANQIFNFNPIIQYVDKSSLEVEKFFEVDKIKYSPSHTDTQNSKEGLNREKEVHAESIAYSEVELDSFEFIDQPKVSKLVDQKQSIGDDMRNKQNPSRREDFSVFVPKTKQLTINNSFTLNTIFVETKPARYFPQRITDTTETVTNSSKHVKNPSLVLDTLGCKVQKLNPWDPSIIDLIETKSPYVCPGPPSFLKSQPGGSLFLNKTLLEIYYNLKPTEIQCYYQDIKREYGKEDEIREEYYSTGPKRKLKFGMALNEDYIQVSCKLKKKRFRQYFPLVHLKNKVEEERNSIYTHLPGLNVILVGIDSVSKLNFLRHFSRTHKFLKETLSPFVMNGYVKVGDNTFPNLIPMLTGHFVEHYWNESLSDTMYFDSLDFVWKEYARKGYRTFYAEDDPGVGTFNYEKRGFYEPPTDYYFRPLALALENSLDISARIKSEVLCFNSQTEADIIFGYLKDFVHTMAPRPYIAFSMVSTMTHDFLNNAGYADEPTFRLLEDLWDSGALNNSLLVLFSDHGLRYGEIRETYIGKMEERMPFMYINVPNWFLEQNPKLAINLQTNQNRLITLFDIHATMIHLLNLKHRIPTDGKVPPTLGTSLFKEISPSRNCAEANILPHWCPCQIFQAVSVENDSVKRASAAIVDDINGQLLSYSGKCALLELDKILDARIGQTNDQVLRLARDDSEVVDGTHAIMYGEKTEPMEDYLITLVTKPGNAVFEGTVRKHPENDLYNVLGISRINKYGKQSWCINSQTKKIFCYCQIQKE